MPSVSIITNHEETRKHNIVKLALFNTFFFLKKRHFESEEKERELRYTSSRRIFNTRQSSARQSAGQTGAGTAPAGKLTFVFTSVREKFATFE